MKINDKLANGLYFGASAIPGAGVGVMTGVVIGAGTPVCEYKGDIFTDIEDVSKRYEYTLKSGFTRAPLIYTQTHPPSASFIDAHPGLCKSELGLGGFVNDARNHTNRVKFDTEEERQAVLESSPTYDPRKKSEVMIEAGYNLSYFVVPNEPIIYLTAIRQIDHGEELFVDYGDAYWAPFAEAMAAAEKKEKKSQEGEVTEAEVISEKESQEEKEKKDELASV